MKQVLAVCFLSTSMLAFGQGVEQTVLQMEKDWSQVGLNKANLANDLKTMDRIMADDWVGLDFQGNANTKAQAIANLKSGTSTTQSIELGPMKVRVFGDTAIVTGSDTEKSTYKGKDSSGKYVWMDCFVKRNGKWQAVASESTKLP
jgi:ketosteroid isomerase-like protein